MGFLLDEDFKWMAMVRSCAEDARPDTVSTTTGENTDRSQRRMQYANIAGLERVSLVKNYVVV